MSQFNARLLEEEDYEVLCDWWKWHRFPVPSREILPNDGKSGIMIYDENGVSYCAGFLYLTNSHSVGWVEFIVSNYAIKDREVREKAIVTLIQSISYLANKSGCKMLFSSLRNENLKQKFIKAGYNVGSKNTVELIKIL
ncbi:hypothetical protein [Galbibacter sp. BG1]